VCLPFGDLLEADLEGQELTVAGWGTTEHGTTPAASRRATPVCYFAGNKSMTLRKVSVPVVSTPTCRRLYQDVKPISKRQICAGADKGRDSCAGDSGGPLKRIDSINHTPRYVQYGIVSYGPTRCGIGGRPGIYTSVGEYMRWILDNLE
jgi:secreted trypsin-like serine protease